MEGFVSRVVTIIVSYSAFSSCIACSEENNEHVEGTLGKNISLSCETYRNCDYFVWNKVTDRSRSRVAGHSQVDPNNRSFIHLSEISLLDYGQYTCYCYNPDGIEICHVYFHGICEVTVMDFNNRNISFNNTSGTNYVNAPKGQRIRIRCPAGETSRTNCENVRKEGSGDFTYSFVVLRKHNSCHVECRIGTEGSCTIHLTLNVTTLTPSNKPLTTSTAASNISSQPFTSLTISVPSSVSTISHHYTPEDEKGNEFKDKSPSFLVIIPLCLLIVLLVGVLCVVCFYMYTSRGKSNSQAKEAENVLNAPHDTTVPITTSYSAFNESSKSSKRCTTGKVVLTELDRQCSDDVYTEVNGAGRQVSLIELSNGVKAENSITKDYYSLVNISNSTTLRSAGTPNESDNDMYAEVNKDDKQSEENENTAAPSCDSSVSVVQ